jgi:hypothetical protein
MFWETKQDYKLQVTELTKQLEAKDLDYNKLLQRYNDTLDSVESAALEKSEVAKQLNDHKQALADADTKHAAELEAVKTSVARKINSTLASIGVTMFANENFSASPEISDQQALVEFTNLKGQEKTEYYNKNKAKITRALLPKS